MSIANKRGASLAAGLLWALLSGAPAVADDTELFVVDASLFPQARPNVLLVIDTSGSMGERISTQPTYDPAVDYGGSCSSDTVYWRTSRSYNPPSCSTDNWIDRNFFKCDAALQAFAAAGYKTDRMGQYNPNDNSQRWEELNDSHNTRYVECEDDHGVHGDGVDAAKTYARDGSVTAMWGSSPGVAWGSNRLDTSYTVYEGNYLNWYYGEHRDEIEKIKVVKDVATNLLDTVDGINVGLMRFNWNVPSDYSGGGDQHGGAVIHEMEDIATAREDLKSALDELDAFGSTPLSETLYEAYRYYRGSDVEYGSAAAPQRSVDASRTSSGSSAYKTPIEFACQKNFIVYLTDGEPQFDDHADGDIKSLYGSCSGNCMDEMAAYLYEQDVSPAIHDGIQNVVTHTIGFDVDLPLLEDTARSGGGKYFQVDNTAELTSALSNIVADILDTQTTFTSPTASVNSFNRSQNLNDLYITMFEPSEEVHWAGNLKKYRLNAADAAIVDVNGNPAVDGDFFAATSHSYWSASADGASITEGGAASKIPTPADRNVYTCLGCASGRSSLTIDSNAVSRGNAALDAAVLGLDADDPSRDNLIDFMRGMDVTNVDGDSSTTARNQMGDPLHAQPATVMYAQDESVVYFATNDGYLHAIDTDSGTELWSFVPEEFLGDMVDLYHNSTVPEKHYGIDGSLRLHIVADNDGTINGSDKVYLYFGLRRGGDTYYALDVTDPETPAFLWRKSSSDMPSRLNLGQSWSNPIPTRVNIQSGSYNSANTTEKLVLIFGAGYDAGHDQPDLPVTPDEGNGIVIVDALDGSVLWYVTRGGGDMGSTSMGSMNYSFAGDIKVVDLDGDGFADRMYAADMGGQVWRFDITNGNTRGSLVAGGVIARLGGAPAADPPREDARRFYYAPDVAVVSNDTHNFMHVGIGSGHRAAPNSLLTHDRFYALRDHNPFRSLTQTEFNAREADPITEADLEEVRDRLDTAVPVDSDGWMMELRAYRADNADPKVWSGEKVLAEARTFDNKLYFTTFTPGASATARDCTPRLGTNRLYIVDLFTGAPRRNQEGNTDADDLEHTDRYMEFRGSIASEAVFLFPSPDDAQTCVGEECTPPPVVCVDLFCMPVGSNDPVSTFWSEESIDQ